MTGHRKDMKGQIDWRINIRFGQIHISTRRTEGPWVGRSRLWANFSQRKNSFHRFEEWCLEQNRKATPTLGFQTGFTDDLKGEQFTRRIREGIATETILVQVNASDKKPINFSMEFDDFHEKKHLILGQQGRIGELHISGAHELEISGAVVNVGLIRGGCNLLRFCDCAFKLLKHESGAAADRIILENCFIGTLDLGDRSIKNLFVYGGTIRTINCPAADAENPLIADALFSDVGFPTSTKESGILRGAQPYRNLRAHFQRLQNYRAANLMRSLELNTELEDEKGLTKWINRINGFFADHGQKPERPLWWAAAIIVFAIIYLTILDGGSLNPEQQYFGWRETLVGSDMYDRFRRSLLLVAQSAINPLGALGPRQLLVADTNAGMFVTGLTGVVVDIFALMSIVGIRRCFKMK